MAFINIGFGNIINTDKVVSIVTPDSAPAKRLCNVPRRKAISLMRRRDADQRNHHYRPTHRAFRALAGHDRDKIQRSSNKKEGG